MRLAPGRLQVLEEATGRPGSSRRRRVVLGSLGGIPPSSLEARDGEEDPRTPLGLLGWVGRLRSSDR